METKSDITIEKTIAMLKKPAFMTVCYKSDWQFSILVEKLTPDGLNYAEYDFDQGKKPFISGSQFVSDIQFIEKKHDNFDSFSKRIRTLKSLSYGVSFSEAMEVETINTFILKSNLFFEGKESMLIDMVADMLERCAYRNGIPNLIISDSKKTCSIQTFQNYLTSISLVLIQGQRQNTCFTIPDDCLNTILFYTMNGFLNTDIFQDKKTGMKKISAECLISEYTSVFRFFIPKSEESKAFIKKLSDVVVNNPNKIDETVKEFTDSKSEGKAIELVEKYHLTRL